MKDIQSRVTFSQLFFLTEVSTKYLGQVGAVFALVCGMEEVQVDAVVLEHLAGVIIGLLLEGQRAGKDPGVLKLRCEA